MLLYRSHWHFASQQNPLREARLLCFSTSTPGGGTSSPSGPDLTPEEIEQQHIDELEARMAAPGGDAILAQSGDTPETRRIALRAFIEMKELEADEVLTGTTIKAADALVDNKLFGDIVVRRLRYGDPREARQDVNNIASNVNSRINDTLDENDTAAAQTVNDIADDTHDDVADVLHTKEREIGATETLEAALAGQRKLQIFLALLDSIPDSSKLYPEEDKKKLREVLQKEYDRLSIDIGDLKILEAWENGSTSPAKFAYTASERWYGEQKTDTSYHAAEKKQKNAELNAFISGTKGATNADVAAGSLPDITDDARWEAYGPDLQQRVRDRMADIVPVKIKIAEINERVSILNKYLDSNKKVEETLREIKQAYLEQNGNVPSGFNPFTMWSDLNNKLGIQWLSLADIASIFKSLKGAIEEVGKQQEQLRRAGAASYFGKLVSKVPGWEEVGQILDATNEKKNNDVKKGYMEYLNSPAISIGFDGMFNPEKGGLLHKHKNDPNRAMAILEVAAQKGMLYDINGDTPYNEAKILGKWPLMDYLPPEWNESQRQNYYETLRYMTLQGREKQADAAKPMPVFSSPEKSIATIKDYIKGRDLWFAKGYMAKVIGKGKAGELSALMANAVLDCMQEDEWLRSVTPEAWFDSIGGLGAGNVAFSMGFMKWKRKGLLKWSEENKGVENPPLDGVNEYTTIREKIKRDILSKHPGIVNEPAKDRISALDMAVAKVLASQTVKLTNGKVISIFQPQYAPYNKGPNNQKDMKIDNSDIDFFELRSEAMMSDPKIVNLILHTNYSGRFDDLDRAGFFIKNVAETAKELDSAATGSPSQKTEMEDAAASFRANMGGKIQNWLEGEMRTSSKAAVATERTKEGKYALLELFNAKVLTIKFLEEYIETKGSSQLAIDLLRLCANDPSSEVKTEAQLAITRLNARSAAPRKKNRGGTAGGSKPAPTTTP